MNNHLKFYCFIILLFCSIQGIAQPKLKNGTWRCELQLTADAALPFFISVAGDKVELVNGDERIAVQSYTVQGDSVFIVPSFFQTEIRASIKDNLMTGLWIDHARVGAYAVPFKAEFGKVARFPAYQKPTVDFSTKWEVHFSSGTVDSSVAIGIFKQDGNHISGTFLTTTGDYRFLDGVVSGDSLYLSAFDGAHAFLFKAVMLPNFTIQGKYWSGIHWSEPWVATVNNSFELPPTNKLTYLKEGYKTISFSFPDAEKKMVSLNDSNFKNKVVLIQIMGSWCPNCMDETRFLVPFYNANHKGGVEQVALDYERKSDWPYVEQTLQHLKNAYNIPYPLLFAGLTKEASASLPMLNKVMGYPTLIILDKKGNVRWIETGIDGPATGNLYNKWCDQISNKVESLLQEK